MSMEELRGRIDDIDRGLTDLFTQRMEVSAEIAAWKREHDLPVLDESREREKLRSVEEMVPEELRDYADALYSLLFDLSRSHQNRVLDRETALTGRIRAAVAETPQLFPERAAVACPGDSEEALLACRRLFRRPMEFTFESYEAVFAAIEKGLCRYGVLPLENSTAGSVNAVYDLMMRHDFRIVRSVRLQAAASEGGFTRYICIARELEIYPGADRTSLSMILPHRPGSLYQVLSRFYALGINLNKLESRPLPERNFEFMFYFDLESSVYAPRFHQLMGELEDVCEEFHYLGSYSEVV